MKNLILSGGGTNCIAQAGALIEFLKDKQLDDLQRVFSSSGGAFVGLAPVLKYNAEEYIDFIKETNFNEFLYAPYGIFSQLYFLHARRGRYGGKKIRETILKVLEKKTGLLNPNFEQLYQKTSIEFYVLTTNQSKRMLQIFSCHHTPKAPVALAIQASMAFPLVFEYVKMAHNPQTDEYYLSPKGDVYLDAGLLDNFGMHVCDIICKKVDSNYQKTDTLGLYIVEGEHHVQLIENNDTPPSQEDHSFFSFLNYIVDIFKLSILHQKTEALRFAEDSERIIAINIDNNFALNFCLDLNQKTLILEPGKKAVERFKQRKVQDLPKDLLKEPIPLRSRL